jgi:enamine deaminase RidA (YjgF/YER057c/UK114 family)
MGGLPAQAGIERRAYPKTHTHLILRIDTKVSERNKLMANTGQVQYINPDALNKNPAFTNVVVVTGAGKTVYVGGQDAVDATGAIVGKGDLAAQTEQVLKNIEIALAAAGAQFEHIIKWNLYIVQGQPLRAGFAAFQRVWGNRPNPPAITAMFVAGLAHPDLLLEMDAIAVVPQ